MKTLKLIALLCLALLISHCGTTDPGPNTKPVSVREVGDVLNTTSTAFLRFADSTGGDPWQAMVRTMWYLREEQSVANVYLIDSSLLEIELRSGLKTSFRFIMTDGAGNAIYRGGSERTGGILNASPAKVRPLPLANHDITNKKVLFYASDTKSLEQVNIQLTKWSKLLAESDLGFEVTIKKDEQCTPQVVESFSNYGLVIIDTHGLQDAFLLGTTIGKSLLKGEEDEVKSAINDIVPGIYEKIASGELKLDAQLSAYLKSVGWQNSVKEDTAYRVFCTSKFIRNLPQMPNTIIFGNMCYSGWVTPSYTIPGDKWVNRYGDTIVNPTKTITTDPIGKAFVDKNLISYYGYTRDLPYAGTSRTVSDEFAGKMESALLERLISTRDSTKIVHLDPTSNAEFFEPERKDHNLYGSLYLRHFGKDDYSYSGCISEFTDERDGQKYKAVCIGKQTWMAENLRFNAPGSDVNPKVDPSKYGRYYNHTTVMSGSPPSTKNPSGVRGICPKGWHIPSLAEWSQLSAFAGGDALSGGALKATTDWTSPNTGASNRFGFNGLPGGMYYADSSVYYFTGNEGYWWATDNGSSLDRHSSITLVHYSPILISGSDGNPDPGNKKNCRCVKD